MQIFYEHAQWVTEAQGAIWGTARGAAVVELSQADKVRSRQHPATGVAGQLDKAVLIERCDLWRFGGDAACTQGVKACHQVGWSMGVRHAILKLSTVDSAVETRRSRHEPKHLELCPPRKHARVC